MPTTGRIPNGALVEREAPGRFADETVARARAAQSRFQHGGAASPTPSTPTRTQRYGVKVAREERPAHRQLQAAVVRRRRPLHGRDRRPGRASPTCRRASSSTSAPARSSSARTCRFRRSPSRTATSPCGSPRRRRSRSPRRSREGETVVDARHRRSTVNQKGGNLAIVGGTNLQTLVERPQPHRAEAAPASSPSCRPSSRPARCRPSWWCNDARRTSHGLALG